MATELSIPADWKEARRWRARVLKQEGWKQQRIAEALGVSKGAVSQWLTTARVHGEEGLRARPRSGAPSRLTGDELGLLPELLAHGAEAYGFRGAVWTCARIAQLIEWVFGVSYHKAHVARLLQPVGWTPQKPRERAAQRQEAQIADWRMAVWEELKKSAAGAAHRGLCG
jgi:transposase